MIMERNLLIIGAGIYGLVAYEIAADMGCFEKIGFADDSREISCNGVKVEGGVSDLSVYADTYTDMVVAIGNPDVRLSLIEKIKQQTGRGATSLISPRAYVSSSAVVMDGCIIEPMSVVHSNCVLSTGCIISAGAVVNHASECSDGVHVDCNATVAGNRIVPVGFKVQSGTVYNA